MRHRLIVLILQAIAVLLASVATLSHAVSFVPEQDRQLRDDRPVLDVRSVVTFPDPQERRTYLEHFANRVFGTSTSRAVRERFGVSSSAIAVTSGGVNAIFSELNKADIAVLVAHGSGDNFQLPNGTFASATDVTASNFSFSKTKVLVCLSCFSARTGGLGTALANKGAPIVITSTSLQSDEAMAQFMNVFLRLLTQGTTIDNAFTQAAMSVRDASGGTPFFDAATGTVRNLRRDLAAGLSGIDQFNLGGSTQVQTPRGTQAGSRSDRTINFDAATGRLTFTNDSIVGLLGPDGSLLAQADAILGANVVFPDFSLAGTTAGGNPIFLPEGDALLQVTSGGTAVLTTEIPYLTYIENAFRSVAYDLSDSLFDAGSSFLSDLQASFISSLGSGDPFLFGIRIYPDAEFAALTQNFTVSAATGFLNAIGPLQAIAEPSMLVLVGWGLLVLLIQIAPANRRSRAR
jgi:hypothetical protein